MKALISALSAACLLSAAVAGSASAQDARIAYGDLDLATAAGAAAFEARIDDAARALCKDAHRPASRLSDREGCAAAVRADAMSQLPRAERLSVTDRSSQPA